MTRLPSAADLLGTARDLAPAFIEDLTAVCAIDSGSYDAAGVDAMADWCEQRFAQLGFTIRRTRHEPSNQEHRLGDLLVAERAGNRRGRGGRVLLLAHLDTVYDAGTAARRPVRVDGDCVTGPGVADDKGGLLAGIYALDVLDRLGFDDYGTIVFCCSPDEEIGSPFSRPHLQALAGDVDVGLCLECARETGAIVSARKGITEVVLEVTGRASHAGVEPERGRSAALEAAYKTVDLHALNGRWPGVTVNVGVVRAGTRPNVVAERAELRVDVRALDRATLDLALAAIDDIAARSRVAGTTAAVRREAAHAPMERTPAVAALVAEAQGLAAELGFDLDEAATGGAADANTVAAAGLPVLDGLGPVGGDDHSPAEWIQLSSIAPRVALLAGLVARLGSGNALPSRRPDRE